MSTSATTPDDMTPPNSDPAPASSRSSRLSGLSRLSRLSRRRRHSTGTLAAIAAATTLVGVLGTALVMATDDAAPADSETLTPVAASAPELVVTGSTPPEAPGAEPAATTKATPASPTAPETTVASPTPTAPVDLQRTASAGTAGALSTSGADIVDADGNGVTIRGVNWFGFETQVGAPHGLWSRNLDDMITQIDALGFNSIRLPFSAAMLDPAFVPNGINYGENPELEGLTSLEVMDRVIDAAAAADLDVILDRHALGPDDRHHLWYNDQYPQERLVTDWQLLADRYGDRDNVIGADLYNEPHDEACWGCGDAAVDWKLAAEAAGNAIHEIDPDWLIIVEGVEQPDGASCDAPETTSCTWWGAALADAGAEPIELAVPDKVVYSPHEYATSVYRQPWFDDQSFPANMPAIWDANWGYLERDDIAPVMVGEFGTTLASNTDAIWLETLLAYLDDIGADFTFWTFNPNSGDTGGVLLDDWLTVDENKMAYLAPYLQQ